MCYFETTFCSSLYYFNATDLLQKDKDKLTAISNSFIGNLKKLTDLTRMKTFTGKDRNQILTLRVDNIGGYVEIFFIILIYFMFKFILIF